MTYQQTLDYLYAQLPMYSRIGKAAYKEDLDNTIALCDAIDNPQTKFKTIHIAGTNGKGSTSHMLAAILQQAGYKTGLYTSPHLKDFRERIKINGEMISEEFVIDFTERTKEVSEKIKPSFFELTVAMAFAYFEKEKVDIAVIETGLGGRLDSTNIISPILSIITNIGYDHMDLLGDTLEKIAIEKAGIIKPNIPVVIGEFIPETKPVFINKAVEMNAEIHFAQEEFVIYNSKYSLQALHCEVIDTLLKMPDAFKLDLNGMYQVKNLCTVLSAVELLMDQGFTISDRAVKAALRNVKKLTGLFGRWDVVHKNPAIILEVAHNEDGIKQMLQHLYSVKPKHAAIHIVMGMVKDKDASKILSLLPKDASYYFSNAHIDRALPHQLLSEKASTYGLIGDSFNDVNLAIASAKKRAKKTDIIIVCGSIFLIGEVEPQLFSSI